MAYTLTKADVTAIAPETATLDDPRWAVILAHATARFSNTDAMGGIANTRICATYMAAHLASLELKRISQGAAGASAGPVIGVTVGPVSRQYASIASLMSEGAKAVDPSLGLTTYGLQLIGFRRAFSFTRGFIAI